MSCLNPHGVCPCAETGRDSNVLREVNINQISNAECDAIVKSMYFNYNIGDYHICFFNEGTHDGSCSVSTVCIILICIILKHISIRASYEIFKWRESAVSKKKKKTLIRTKNERNAKCKCLMRQSLCSHVSVEARIYNQCCCFLHCGP
jgi:hypothetical protein